MNKHHIVTTINPATAVTCSGRGKFINSFEDNLIVCKGSTVEIYNTLNDGIKIFTQFNIYGVIACMQPCMIPDRSTCSIFLLTDQYRFTILSYSPKTQTMITEGHGILEEVNARVTDQPISTVVDTKTDTILVSSHTGLIFAIPLGSKTDTKGKGRETKVTRFQPSCIKTHEFDFLSMACVKGFQQPTLSALLGEINELKTLKTFRYTLGNTDLVEIEKAAVKVESTAHTLIPVPEPIGGVLAIGEYIVSYHDLIGAGGTKELSIDLVLVTAYTFLTDDPIHLIMGDSEGYLYYLTLDISNSKVNGLSIIIIGQASIPTSIVDLGNDIFYIASAQGDPCVIKLVMEGMKRTVQVLQTFSNLGPILDFCLFDYDGQGKQTMVCCSGGDKDGSLRIVENGVGFVEHYIMDIPLITNVWTLGDILLVSTALESIVIQYTQMDMRELEQYSQLILNETTLTSAITKKGHILQVTPTAVRLVESRRDGKLKSEWRPPHGGEIAVVKANTTQCVLCYGRGMLVYLDTADDVLVQKCVQQFLDIACISLSPKEENGVGQDLVLIGMWTQSKVQVLQLPNLNVMLDHALDFVTGPKDVLMIRIENISYLMVLLGDGQMLSYNIVFRDSVPVLRNARQTMVGTYCTSMYPFYHEGEQKIFITGIRPTIITSWHQKLLFSAVNLKNVYALAPFHDMIILMTDTGLLFGKTDVAQKLHHSKVNLNNEMPTRIQYLPQSKSLAVGTVLIQKDANNGFVKRIGRIQILDAQTFQVLDTCSLFGNEIVECMTMAQFDAYPNQEFLFVGTAIENEEDPDQSYGRILVFDIKDNSKCELLESIKMPGIIYNLRPFQNSIIACINGSIFTLQSFVPDAPMGSRVEFKSNIHNNVLAFRMDTEGDRVLIGDLMQSVSVLTMTNRDPLTLKLLAVDNKPSWMTAVKFVNENVYIGSDDRSNVFTLSLDTSRQPHSKGSQSNMSSSGILKLQLEGGYHIGSLVNCFRPGILLDTLSSQNKRHNENEVGSDLISTESPFTFVTVHGSIGTIKTISKHTFDFFKEIQDNILKEMNNIGELSHQHWRSYKPKVPQQANLIESNYLDGDILKSFQYLNLIEKQKILNLTSPYKVKDIEDFINSLVS